MIRGVCDTGDRIAARIYVAVRRALDPAARVAEPERDCPCCAFWRGAVVVGGTAAALAVALCFALKG